MTTKSCHEEHDTLLQNFWLNGCCSTKSNFAILSMEIFKIIFLYLDTSMTNDWG